MFSAIADFFVNIASMIWSFIQQLIMAILLVNQSFTYVQMFLSWLPPAFAIFALVFLAVYVLNFILGFIKK